MVEGADFIGNASRSHLREIGFVIFIFPVRYLVEPRRTKRNPGQDREFARRAVRPGYEIRFFPPELKVAVDSMLAGSRLAVVAFAPEPHALIIESEAMVTSFRSLWELAWRGATPYRVRSKERRP